MQTYDLLMLLVLVATTMFGFWKGMAWQIASLASLLVSYSVSLKFSEELAPVFGNTAPWNRFVAMLVIYIVTSFVIWTIFRLVSGIIDRVKLNGFDHQIGGLIGFSKGVLLCVAITFFAVMLLPQAQKDAIVASRSGHYIVVLLDKADAIVPEEIHQVIGPYIHRIEQQLDPNYQPEPGHEIHASWPKQPAGSWPTDSWPTQAKPESSWPEQQPPTTVDQPAWPPQPQPAWPDPPQTADRPTDAPI